MYPEKPLNSESGCIHPGMCTGSIRPLRGQRQSDNSLERIWCRPELVGRDNKSAHRVEEYIGDLAIVPLFRRKPYRSEMKHYSPVPHLYPENNQTGIEMPAVHVLDQFGLFRSILVFGGCVAGGSGLLGILGLHRTVCSSGRYTAGWCGSGCLLLSRHVSLQTKLGIAYVGLFMSSYP